MDRGKDSTTLWISLVSIRFALEFMEKIGMSAEDVSFEAAVRLIDFIESSEQTEVGIVIHRDEDTDNEDCNMYDNAGLETLSPYDVLMDSATLDNAGLSCRNTKQVIHYALTASTRFALLDQAFRQAGYTVTPQKIANASEGMFQAQAEALYIQQFNYLGDLAGIEVGTLGAANISGPWGENALSVFHALMLPHPLTQEQVTWL